VISDDQKRLLDIASDFATIVGFILGIAAKMRNNEKPRKTRKHGQPTKRKR